MNLSDIIVNPGDIIPFTIEIINKGNVNLENNYIIKIDFTSSNGTILGNISDLKVSSGTFEIIEGNHINIQTQLQPINDFNKLTVTGNYNVNQDTPIEEIITSTVTVNPPEEEKQWGFTDDSQIVDSFVVTQRPSTATTTNIWTDRPSIGLLSTVKIYAEINNIGSIDYISPLTINVSETLAVGQIRKVTPSIGTATIEGKKITITGTIPPQQKQKIVIEYYTGLVLGSVLFTLSKPSGATSGILSTRINIINL